MTAEDIVSYLARRKVSNLLNFTHAKKNTISRIKGEKPILMYIHIPFCEELCPYCSFHRVPFDKDLAKRYFQALKKEILIYRDFGFKFDGVYVGGGTPTVMMEELLSTLHLVKENFSVSEISLETNPNHLTDENIRSLKEIGVKRLSVGVQSFDDEILKSVQRYHKYGSGKAIIEKIKKANGIFQTLNIDMIFNFPNQTLSSLENDIKIIMELAPNQVTYYPLMVSHRTRKLLEEKLGYFDLRKERIFYDFIVESLSRDYFPATAWCFSKAEGMIDEYVVNYDEYAGLGSGSIGYVSGRAYANTFQIPKYISKIEKGELPIEGVKSYRIKERIQYDFLMKLFGLRLDLDQLDRKYGFSTFLRLIPEIFFFSALGALKIDGSKISLTRKGLYYWVIMMREFFIGVNNFRDFLRSFQL